MNIHLLPGLDPARLATLLSSRNPALALRERDYAVQADQSDAYINSMRAMAEAARLDAELAQLTALAAGDPLPEGCHLIYHQCEFQVRGMNLTLATAFVHPDDWRVFGQHAGVGILQLLAETQLRERGLEEHTRDLFQPRQPWFLPLSDVHDPHHALAQGESYWCRRVGKYASVLPQALYANPADADFR